MLVAVGEHKKGSSGRRKALKEIRPPPGQHKGCATIPYLFVPFHAFSYFFSFMRLLFGLDQTSFVSVPCLLSFFQCNCDSIYASLFFSSSSLTYSSSSSNLFSFFSFPFISRCGR